LEGAINICHVGCARKFEPEPVYERILFATKDNGMRVGCYQIVTEYGDLY